MGGRAQMYEWKNGKVRKEARAEDQLRQIPMVMKVEDVPVASDPEVVEVLLSEPGEYLGTMTRGPVILPQLERILGTSTKIAQCKPTGKRMTVYGQSARRFHLTFYFPRSVFHTPPSRLHNPLSSLHRPLCCPHGRRRRHRQRQQRRRRAERA